MMIKKNSRTKRSASPTSAAGSSTRHKPPAVVVGFDSMQGLPTARTLARKGVPVFGITSNRKHALARTNVCKEVIVSPTDDDRLIGQLIELGQRLDERAVLFPCEDTNVAVISRNRNLLAPYYHVMLPEHETVAMLMDKVTFYSYALENDLPIPLTMIVRNSADIHEAAEKISYPCILKPHDSAARNWEDETIFKAFKVHDANELIATYQHYNRWTDCFIVQEWIDGTDSDLYSCNCYFDRSSKPLVTFTARKLRQWPPETGVSCLGEEVRNEAVLETALRLFGGVSYHGLGYLEMKLDKRTGRYLIIEPNIGRPTGRSSIAEAGGVELVYTAYCDAVGLPLPANREQTYEGVKWIHLRKDIQSSIQYWRRGELTFRDWWRSVRGKKAFAVASWRDPWPFLFDWLAAFRSFLSPRNRKKRGVKHLQSGRRDD